MLDLAGVSKYKYIHIFNLPQVFMHFKSTKNEPNQNIKYVRFFFFFKLKLGQENPGIFVVAVACNLILNVSDVIQM